MAISTLARVVVIDVTQGLCGPGASRLLGDAGARVIKVEPLTGDYSRQMGPPFIGGDSAVYLALNCNKLSIAIDLDKKKGQTILRRLVRKADVFLEDWGPGKAEARGFGYEQLAQENPDLVYCAITPFGERGPLADRAGSELVLQCMTDLTNTMGVLGEAPVRTGADVAEMITAPLAFNTIIGALLERAHSGKGQRVSISMYGTLLWAREGMWAAMSDPDDWYGDRCEATTRPPDYGYATKDKPIYFYIQRPSEDSWYRLLIDLGLEEVVTDPRFAEGWRDCTGTAGRYVPDVKPIWERAFTRMPRDELIPFLRERGAEAFPVHDYDSLFQEPQVAEVGAVVELDHPKAGKIKAIAAPWKLTDVMQRPDSPPPLLGQHTRDVLRELGYEEAHIEDLRARKVIHG